MPSFNFDIGEQARIGAQFLSDVRDELQRALTTEKSMRKITQQQIAEKVGTSRAVINRQLMGLENLGLRRVAEILWAIGWEPHFEARKIPYGTNYHDAPKRVENSPAPSVKSAHVKSEPDPVIRQLLNDIINKQNSAPTPAG